MCDPQISLWITIMQALTLTLLCGPLGNCFCASLLCQQISCPRTIKLFVKGTEEYYNFLKPRRWSKLHREGWEVLEEIRKALESSQGRETLRWEEGVPLSTAVSFTASKLLSPWRSGCGARITALPSIPGGAESCPSAHQLSQLGKALPARYSAQPRSLLSRPHPRNNPGEQPEPSGSSPICSPPGLPRRLLSPAPERVQAPRWHETWHLV